MRALANQLIIRLDPEKRISQGGIAPPDQHYHRICAKCKLIDEAMRDYPVCRPDPIFDFDYKERQRFRGDDTSHKPIVVTAPVVIEQWRRATVLACGPYRMPLDFEDDDELEDGPFSTDFEKGDRILVRFDTGRPLDNDPNSPFRTVPASSIAMFLEEE